MNIPLILFLLLIGVTSVTAVAQPPAGFGTTPTFDEEFNGTSLNTTNWTYRGLGTVRGQCTLTASAVAVNSGYARISTYTSGGVNYCGAISTSGTGQFNQTYGYWEASVRYQYQPGAAVAWWMQAPTTGAVPGNPQQSGVEMDIFEHQQGFSATEFDHALHWNGYPASNGTNLYEQTAPIPPSTTTWTLSNLNDGNFHKFGLAWTPGSYTFYVDGVAQYSVDSSVAAISDIAEFVILDSELATATGIPSGGYGTLGASTNSYIDVDYVKVYPYSKTVTTTTLSATANAYVRDGAYATTNYAGYLDVKADAAGYNRNSYLMFDLTGLTGTVAQATLYMTPSGLGETYQIWDAAYVTGNAWTETGITWNTQPTTGARLSHAINWNTGMLANYDVTNGAVVGQMLSIELVPETSGSPTNVIYSTRTDSTPAYRPKLVVLTTP